jgi:hypothetical protein
VVWIGIALRLANHEFALPAQQPLHFTRGFIWLGLALLGLEPLACILRRAQVGGIRAVALAAGLCFILPIDNSAFLVRSMKDQLDARYGWFLTGSEARLLEFASSHPLGGPLFATNNRKLSCLSVAMMAGSGSGRWRPGLRRNTERVFAPCTLGISEPAVRGRSRASAGRPAETDLPSRGPDAVRRDPLAAPANLDSRGLVWESWAVVSTGRRSDGTGALDS